MKLKSLWLSLLSLVIVFSLVGCSPEASTSEARKTGDGKIKVTFWHAMNGTPGDLIKSMVDKYNASQSKYFVEASYQGTYEEALTKLKAVGGTKEAPTIMQAQEIATKYMIDSGFVQPVQDFIDKDNYDLSKLEENILGYYQVNGKLYSMPFNTSNSILFYNKDKFKAAGLDPENPPTTYAEIREAAKKLTNSNDKGFSLVIYGWFVEQLLANQGADMVDHGNGRDALATKSLLDSKQSLEIFKWLDDMNKDGSIGNYGRKFDDVRAAFRAGKVAMFLDSTAGTPGNVKDVPFQVGTAFMPSPDGKNNGVIVGGASLWIMNSVAEEEKEGAWDFMKFMTQPETQAEWAAGTGYFPITKAAYDQQVLKDTYAKYPQFTTAVKQLQQTKLSSATKGALISVFPEARLEVATAIERVYKGEDPQKVVDELNKKVTGLIEENNKVSQK
ncbi:ABC transporter substrate-binding protein [Paenibacillus sp. JMULE4]|uniref:ABC transporter substrate-binding protein n=1 Tax=Paenibacillus sp. JMULE4 TaxID=2518342 RepID=UPI0015759B36|nr:ABC transporter substrate-binding protein [Paenibacillus sp. JMULE4]NTZ19851.1 ABC transporter substrate-binding protein [Paenibacillus sp. JMULE4]